MKVIQEGQFTVIAVQAFNVLHAVSDAYDLAKEIFSEVSALMDLMRHSTLSGESKKESVLAFLKGFWRYSTAHYDEWAGRIAKFIDLICDVAKGVATVVSLVAAIK